MEKPSWLPAFNKEKRAAEVQAKLEAGEPIVVNPDYSVGGSFLAVGTLFNAVHLVPLGVGLTFLGAFLTFQTANVKFICGDKDFYVKIGLGQEEDLRDSLENWAVGGENRWPYDSFTNWTFFPSRKADSEDAPLPFPILVYFKETHTPEEKWNEGPGQLDKVGGGQIHFFPCVVDSDELASIWEAKGCARKE